ncbi:MAG: AMP phosphorylase [Candidatus Altiarchaeota archaeon]|nr:AMP phosphorylase [Candidatus Altiarchaeota archaeon]
MKFKVKTYAIEAGRPIVILHFEDLKELGVYVSDRVELAYKGRKTVALIDTTKSLIQEGSVGVSYEVIKLLRLKEGDMMDVKATKRPQSVEYIKKKINGEVLHKGEIKTIIEDIVSNNLSDVELSAFVTAGYINGYNMDEIVALTNSMVETGQQIDFGSDIVDKHCIGGVAGNRTTLIIVPIIAAAGLTIPKTSSRAITSPSGTADTMGVLANVEFGIDELKEIVNKTGACIIWGGALNLAPADDKIIRAEYPLSIDPEGQVLASVMAKKKSVGSDYVIIDIPVGKGAKIGNGERAKNLAEKFIELGRRMGIYVECLITDGTAPIGSGIGPALEARDCLLALQNKGPVDLINKSLDLAEILLELSGRVGKNKGRETAEKILYSGEAYEKMKEIIEAQGGDPEMGAEDIKLGSKTYTIKSKTKGNVRYIDNKGISQVARAAGAPKDVSAGVYMHVNIRDCIKVGSPLYTIYARNNSKLEDAIKLSEKTAPVRIGGVILDKIK